MLSKAIENYLKAIFSIKAQGTDVVSTNAMKKLNGVIKMKVLFGNI